MIGWRPADLQARPRIGMIDTGVNPTIPHCAASRCA